MYRPISIFVILFVSCTGNNTNTTLELPKTIISFYKPPTFSFRDSIYPPTDNVPEGHVLNVYYYDSISGSEVRFLERYHEQMSYDSILLAELETIKLFVPEKQITKREIRKINGRSFCIVQFELDPQNKSCRTMIRLLSLESDRLIEITVFDNSLTGTFKREIDKLISSLRLQRK